MGDGFYAPYPMFERHWLEQLSDEYWKFETWMEVIGED